MIAELELDGLEDAPRSVVVKLPSADPRGDAVAGGTLEQANAAIDQLIALQTPSWSRRMPDRNDWLAQGRPDLDPPTPSTLMATVEETAQAGYVGMTAGRRLVIPGLAVKVVAMAGRYLPRTLWLRFSGRLVAPK